MRKCHLIHSCNSEDDYWVKMLWHCTDCPQSEQYTSAHPNIFSSSDWPLGLAMAWMGAAAGSLLWTKSAVGRRCLAPTQRPLSSIPVKEDFLTGLVRDRPELVSHSDVKASALNKHMSNGNVRRRVTRTMMAKVQAKEENWAYNIHNLIFMIRNDGLVTSDEAQVLMKACQRDILDLMPVSSQILTELAWETVSADSTTITGIQLPSLYANMLDAFTFQNIDANINQVREAMSEHCSEIAYGTKNSMVKHLCWQGKVEEAWELQKEGRGMAWSENLASHFVQGYARLGRMDAAEDMLQMLNDKNIHWGNICYEAMVLGCAGAGDMDRVEFFLDRLKGNSDELLLGAIVEASRAHPDKMEPLLRRQICNVEVFSNKCRRAVKILVESGNYEASWRIVRKTRLQKIMNTDKERVIKICPSVILVSGLLSQPDLSVEPLVKKIESLVPMDPKIMSRTVPLAIDLCFKNSQPASFCKALIAHIKDNFPQEDDAIRNLIGQSSKRLMRNASTSESDDEVYNVFRVFSSLGLKMEGKGQSGSSRGWDLLLNQLLPTIPKEGAWTEQSLKYQCWEVRNNLAKHCDGLYSNSVIWGSILQHLLNRENKLFFLVAANLSKELQVPYAPRRWVLSLANCLVKLEDVKSFVDILEVAYNNSAKRGNWDDLEVVTEALLHFTVRGSRQAGKVADGSTHALRAHQVLVWVLDEVWARKLRLPGRQV